MEAKRPYRMSARAKARDGTRQRIVEAAMRLHEEIGPRATTISAIAKRSGVQRLTVYRHFPAETAVFEACTAHWLARNPPPEPAAWARLEPPARLRAALAAFNAYYAKTRRMWAASHRDVDAVPALHGPMAAFRGFVAGVADALARDLGADAAVAATIGHALAFPTWEDLEARGLDDAAKAALASKWIDGAGA
jgi:AcrR family transcriptional regulator